MECPFGIWLTANQDGSKLVVSKVSPEHNHEVRKVSVWYIVSIQMCFAEYLLFFCQWPPDHWREMKTAGGCRVDEHACGQCDMTWCFLGLIKDQSYASVVGLHAIVVYRSVHLSRFINVKTAMLWITQTVLHSSPGSPLLCLWVVAKVRALNCHSFGIHYMCVTTQEIVENLPKRRRLDATEKEDVQHMLRLHANKWLIQQHFLKNTGIAGVKMLCPFSVYCAKVVEWQLITLIVNWLSVFIDI